MQKAANSYTVATTYIAKAKFNNTTTTNNIATTTYNNTYPVLQFQKFCAGVVVLDGVVFDTVL